MALFVGGVGPKLACVIMAAYRPLRSSAYLEKATGRHPHGHGRAMAPHACIGVGMYAVSWIVLR